MREPVFNRGGGKALIVIVVTLGFCYWYAGIARSVIDSGSWLWFVGLAVFPLVLGYIVGNEDDRADYHRIKDWLVRKLRLR